MLNTESVTLRVADFFSSRATDVAAVYLFGSVARGTQAEASDVDLAVLLRREPPKTVAGLRLDLQADLEQSLQVPVHLVVLNTAPCDLIHRVLRDGILVIDHDPSLRIRFEVRARNEYFDLEPVLRRYRRPVPSRAGAG